MEQEYEVYKANLRALCDSSLSQDHQRNEATTRLHIIDTLFTTCLGWDKSMIVLEQQFDGEYADYVFNISRPILIVEAKKEGDYYTLPVGFTQVDYSLKTLYDDNKNLKKAVDQVARYCQTRGVQYAAISNGHQIIVFLATRTDGISPLEGRALAFPSLEHMYEHFIVLWNSLSPKALEEDLPIRRLLNIPKRPLPAKLSAQLPAYPGNKRRNIFQTDLQFMSELVLEDLPREDEIEVAYLTECYYRSGSISQYALISKAILEARYASLLPTSYPSPAVVPAVDKSGVSTDLLANALSNRPILVIGDVGVGKTMFLRHLLKIDAAEQLKNAIALCIDLGSKATLTTDISEFVINELGNQLNDSFGIDIYRDGFVRGIYAANLNRFSKSPVARLREIDPNTYQREEVRFLLELTNNKGNHLIRAVEYIVKTTNRQIVVFLDNSDQRDDSTQQKAFLIAQEFAKNTKATVFISLRPETFYRSLRAGALSGYHPKAFTISPPRVDRVLEKRLRFGLKITSGEMDIPNIDSVRVRAQSLDAIMHVFLETIARDSSLIEFIDNISGGNIRQALEIVKMFFGSGHVDTQKIINKYQQNGSYFIPLHEFLRAVIYGDAEYYDPSRSVIANLFDVESLDPKEHFLLPVTICSLAAMTKPELDEGFVRTDMLYDHIQTLGFLPRQLDAAVIRAVHHKLIDVPGRVLLGQDNNRPASLRANASGVYHVTRLCCLFPYLDAIIVDTPILDSCTRYLITDSKSIQMRLDRAEIFIQYLDKQWADTIGSVETYFQWPMVSVALKEDIGFIRGRN